MFEFDHLRNDTFPSLGVGIYSFVFDTCESRIGVRSISNINILPSNFGDDLPSHLIGLYAQSFVKYRSMKSVSEIDLTFILVMECPIKNERPLKSVHVITIHTRSYLRRFEAGRAFLQPHLTHHHSHASGD